MSSFEHNMLVSLTSKFDEKQWVKQIRKTLDEELEEEIIHVTIFGVPKPLMMSDPDSYMPQQVAVGPYHHLRPELYDMERYKVAAAKRNQKDHQNVKIQDLVDHLMKQELRIRAYYHRPLSFGSEALAWMMAVDVCFLHEFVQVCGVKKGKAVTEITSRWDYLKDLSRNKTAQNTILGDVIMLENQIPLFVMRMLLEMQFSSLDLADETLLDMLIGLSEDLSPFKMVESSKKFAVDDCAHLLEFLYHFIVPKTKTEKDPVKEAPSFEIHAINIGEGEDQTGVEQDNSFATPPHLRQFLDATWQLLSNIKPIERIKRIIFSEPLKFVVKLPWTTLSKIPVIKMFKQPVENMFMGALHKDKEKKDDEESGANSNNNNEKPPLQEEIAIPSVTQLVEAGVRFSPTNGDISSIKFDKKNLSFHIPIMELDVHSEVVLRNLVAYEGCSVSGALVLTRYTELMNGIIDTEEDAEVLSRRGIIINHLKNEKEVADLWNGMSKSIRLTKVQSLDKVIADVNKFYNGRWKVKLERFMKQHVFASWRILTFFAAIMMLLLMCLQAFCEVYACGRILPGPVKAFAPTSG